MAWIFNLRPDMCTNTYQEPYPHEFLVDAIKACRKKNSIMDVNILQWTQVSLKDAKILARTMGQWQYNYKWARSHKK